MTESVSLFQLVNEIKDVLSGHFNDAVWVRAEIGDINYHAKGHCYLELIEKNEGNEKIVARVKAHIWSYSLRMLKPFFETSTGRELETGIKVLVHAYIEMHELYGLSLNIINIDPSYTVGDIELQRQATIRKLMEAGIIDLNKELDIPLVPQRIAIVSSSTAAGYEDFMKQLNDNGYGYKYYCKLFPAIMQGKEAEDSIIKSLDKIYEYENYFDVVVIIRGGGAKSDLDCYDRFELAQNIAQFPLPVLTGIGHERDVSIADMVACHSLKTPTAVAGFLIDIVLEFESALNQNIENIVDIVSDVLESKRSYLMDIHYEFGSEVKQLLTNNDYQVNIYETDLKHAADKYLNNKLARLKQSSFSLKHANSIQKSKKEYKFDELSRELYYHIKKQINTEEHRVDKYMDTVSLLNPENILKRGYTITYKDNKIVKNIDDLNKNDQIVTVHKTGTIKSKVDGLKKK